MIVYKIPGSFYNGILFEDFFSKNKRRPNVTISVDPENVLVGANFTILPDFGDTWKEVAVGSLNAKIAKEILAYVNRVPEEEIHIIEAHQVVSV